VLPVGWDDLLLSFRKPRIGERLLVSDHRLIFKQAGNPTSAGRF
jgi:hypothetical protein